MALDLNKPFKLVLADLGACNEGKTFGDKYPTAEAAWALCDDPMYLLWGFNYIHRHCGTPVDPVKMLRAAHSIIVDSILCNGYRSKDLIILRSTEDFLNNVPAQLALPRDRWTTMRNTAETVRNSGLAWASNLSPLGRAECQMHCAAQCLATAVVSPRLPENGAVDSAVGYILSANQNLNAFLRGTNETFKIADAALKKQICDIVRANVGANPFVAPPLPPKKPRAPRKPRTVQPQAVPGMGLNAA